MATDYRIGVEEAVKIAVALQQEGHLGPAEEVYRDILEAAPQHADTLHFYGILKHQAGDSDRGVEMIQRAIELEPRNPGMRSNLGNVLKELGQPAAAEAAYRVAVELDENYADGFCNLGVVLRSQKKYDEAEVILTKAIALDPQHGEAYHNLGNVYRDRGDLDKAIEYFDQAIDYNGYRMVGGKVARNLADTLVQAGRLEYAAQKLREWLAVEPDNAIALHTLACVIGEQVPERASDAYIRATFEPFAGDFDEQLEKLKYRAPELVGRSLKKRLGKPAQDLSICDLGCGTGLVAKYVKSYASNLVGVDLSAGMLQKARQRGYDELVEAELTEYLSGGPARFDVITCVDTFVYFGELGRALQACASSLNPGGRLCFTLERCEPGDGDADYRLQHHGRYSHQRAYVYGVLRDAQFDDIDFDEVTLRMERGRPVAGFVVSGSL